MPIGFPDVANFANVYPGTALGVVANAQDGYGNSVGGATVIVGEQTTPTDYFILLESGDFVLQETGFKILLEIS
jgi:hypothetical protein